MTHTHVAYSQTHSKLRDRLGSRFDFQSCAPPIRLRSVSRFASPNSIFKMATKSLSSGTLGLKFMNRGKPAAASTDQKPPQEAFTHIDNPFAPVASTSKAPVSEPSYVGHSRTQCDVLQHRTTVHHRDVDRFVSRALAQGQRHRISHEWQTELWSIQQGARGACLYHGLKSDALRKRRKPKTSSRKPLQLR